MGHDAGVALITGAGSGIGRACALRLAETGAVSVALVDLSAANLSTVASEVEARGASCISIRADVGSAEECTSAVNEAAAALGTPTVVISNVGTSSFAPFLDTRFEDWATVMDLNLGAGFRIGQAAARLMVENGVRGVLIYTASIAARGAISGVMSYCVSKAGVVSMVKNMALELAPHGIRVVSVSPGWTDTPGSASLEGEEQMRRYREEGFPYAPFRRLAQPEEIAALVAFLASTDASYISGTDIVIDGAMTAAAFATPEVLRA